MTPIRKIQRFSQGFLFSLIGLVGNAPAMNVPELDCVIEPHMVIDLSSRTDGIVESIEVDRGDVVEQGQVVVKLESGVEQAAVEYARVAANADSDLQARKTSMDFAQRRHGRMQSLYQEKVLSSDQMDEMKTEALLTELERDQAHERRRLAQLELRQALEVLERHTILSPISGVVVQRFLAPGESVEEKPILRLAQINPLRVEVIVPVSYFGKVEPGQMAVIMPERPMQGEYSAQVTVVDRVADAASGTYRVRLSLPNPEYKLPSGLKCMVRFLPMAKSSPTSVAQASAVPAAAPKLPAKAEAVARPAANNLPAAAPVTAPGKRVTAHGPIAIAHAGLSSTPPNKPAAKAMKARQPMSRVGGAIQRPRKISAATATNTDNPRREEIVAACRTIGPLDDEDRVQSVKAALQGNVDHLVVRRQVSDQSAGFVILSTDQQSVAAAKALAKKMQVAGVEDLFVFGRGPHKGRVSLGLYKGPKMAAARAREVESFGFSAEVIPRESRQTRYFVDVEVGRSATDGDLPEAARKLLAAENAAPADCSRLVAAHQ